jgi:hypothetical protein
MLPIDILVMTGRYSLSLFQATSPALVASGFFTFGARSSSSQAAFVSGGGLSLSATSAELFHPQAPAAAFTFGGILGAGNSSSQVTAAHGGGFGIFGSAATSTPAPAPAAYGTFDSFNVNS